MTVTPHTYLIAKASSQAIILTAISLFLIPLASSIDFSIDIPDEMALSQDIDVGISAPNESDYDVKVFFESDGSELPGEIETGDGWKSTRFYIQDISFKVKSFTIRLKEPDSSISSLSVCVRLRDAASSSTPNKECSGINIVDTGAGDKEAGESGSSDTEEEKDDLDDGSSTEENSSDESGDAESEDEADDRNEQENAGAPGPKPQTKPKAIQQASSNEDSESTQPIILKNLAEEVEYTGAGKSRIIMNYIIALTVLIALFMLLRSEKQYREI